MTAIFDEGHLRFEFDDTWQVDRMRRRQPPIKVIVWLEDEAPPGTANQPLRDRIQLQMLKQQLAWLTTKVMVHNHKGIAPPNGVNVTNLPGAGQI